jgi:hypothetical protein
MKLLLIRVNDPKLLKPKQETSVQCYDCSFYLSIMSSVIENFATKIFFRAFLDFRVTSYTFSFFVSCPTLYLRFSKENLSFDLF